MLKFTLIPEGYFPPDVKAEDLLSKVVVLEKTDSVKKLELPCYKAVLLYAGDDAAARRLADMLEAAADDPHNSSTLAKCRNRSPLMVSPASP